MGSKADLCRQYAYQKVLFSTLSYFGIWSKCHEGEEVSEEFKKFFDGEEEATRPCLLQWAQSVSEKETLCTPATFRRKPGGMVRSLHPPIGGVQGGVQMGVHAVVMEYLHTL